MDEKVMVMAAGLGARLMPLTGEIAKPMVPIVNRPVMEHLFALISGCGFHEVVVNLHHFPEAIRDYFGDGSRWGVSIHYSVEENLMGTAGGVKKCADFLGSGTFVVLSGDALTDVDLRELLAFHHERKSVATIVTTPVEDTSKYGVVLAGEDGRVEGFQEKPTEAEAMSNVANSGIYVFEPEILDLIPRDKPYDFGRELFPRLVKDGAALYAWTHRYYWNDVGSIEEYQQGNFDALNGVVNVDIPGNQIAPGIWVGADTTVNRDVIMTPPVCIGDRCVIERGARILGPVIIGPDTMVRAGAVLYRGIKWGGGYIGRDASMVGSIAGSDFHIGEGAVLLDGVVLGSGSVVEDGIVIDPSVRIMPGTVVNNNE